MKKDNKKTLYESIMASVAKEVKKVLNEGQVREPKSLEQILIELVQKYDNIEITAENVIKAIRKELNIEDVPHLYAGSFLNGIIHYKDKTIKITTNTQLRINKTFFSYWIEGSQVKNSFLIDNQDAPKELRFYWVDKEGIEHNTKEEWEKAAVKYKINGMQVIGIEWKQINISKTMKEYTKKLYELIYHN